MRNTNILGNLFRNKTIAAFYEDGVLRGEQEIWESLLLLSDTNEKNGKPREVDDTPEDRAIIHNIYTSIREEEKLEEPDPLKRLMKQFSVDERERLITERPRGKPSKVDEELFHRRDAAIIKLFKEISANSPQTKRHCYYIAKALGLCGADPSSDDPYFSSSIAEIITQACWDKRLDWEKVLDETRSLNTPTFWENAATFRTDTRGWFEVDLNQGQRVRVVVCTEKDAVIESVSYICSRNQIPSMSFHGQASDGAVYKLAKHIASWQDECEEVQVAYLGDFDPGGLVISQTVFGDSMDTWDFGDESRNKHEWNVGKLDNMLMEFFPIHPKVYWKRIGITRDDLDNPDYEQFIMHTHNTKDTMRKEFLELRDGDDRTMGIDVLSTEDIERRLEDFIDEHRNQTVWAERHQYLESEQAKLEVENA